jgi:hypothetical protein
VIRAVGFELHTGVLAGEAEVLILPQGLSYRSRLVPAEGVVEAMQGAGVSSGKPPLLVARPA